MVYNTLCSQSLRADGEMATRFTYYRICRPIGANSPGCEEFLTLLDCIGDEVDLQLLVCEGRVAVL